MSQDDTTAQETYIAPSVTSYTEVDLFSLMEEGGAAGTSEILE